VAKVIFGPVVSEARNKQGNLVFSRNRWGAFTRALAPDPGPAIGRRKENADTFAAVAPRWSANLTEAQRAAWRALALTANHTDVFGKPKRYSGFHLFVSLNLNLQYFLNTLLDNAPPDLDVTAPTNLLATTASAPDSLSITFAPTPVPADHALAIFATDTLAPGINNPGQRYSLIDVLDEGTNSPQDLTSAWAEVWGEMTGGNRLFLSAKLVNKNNGVTSASLRYTAGVTGTGVCMFKEVTTLTDAQIKALPTTAVTIVPLTAGKIIVPLAVLLQVDHTAAAYTNISAGVGNYISARFGGWDSPRIPNDNLLTPAGKRTTFLPLHLYIDAVPPTVIALRTYSYLDGDLEGSALEIRCTNALGNFTGGNAANSMKVTVYYQLIDAI